VATRLPDIPPINRMDQRLVNQAFDAVRQRLAQLERQAQASSAVTGTTPQGQNAPTTALQAQIAALRRDLDALAATVALIPRSGSEAVVTLVADGSVPEASAVLATGPGQVSIADPYDPALIHGVFGVSESYADDGGDVLVRRWGQMELQDVSFEVGRAVYAAPGGGLIQEPQAYGDVAICVGVAITPSSIWVAPRQAVMLSTMLSDYGREDFLPVGYGLVKMAVALAEAFNQSGDGILVKIGDTLAFRSIEGIYPVGVLNGSGVEGNPMVYFGDRPVPAAADLALTGEAPDIILA
jgi:hypothetical protein